MIDGREMFFFDREGDKRMEEQNGTHWDAILGYVKHAIETEDLPKHLDVLDIGCHTGGLLGHLQDDRVISPLISGIGGIEPIHEAREKAWQRIRKPAKGGVRFFENLKEVPDQT